MIQAFIAKVRENMELAETLYGVDMSKVQVRCDIKGYRTAGQAGRKNGQYYLRFHPVAIQHHYNTMVKNTIPHEVAHLVAFMLGKGFRHDSWWRYYDKGLGGNGERCHSMDIRIETGYTGTTRRKTVSKKFLYRCENGKTIELGLGRHNSLRTGKVLYYVWGNNGKITKQDFVKRVA